MSGFLPVFVPDRYEGYEVKLVQDCTREELDRWAEANAAAIREHLPADLVFVDHVLMGGPVGKATGAVRRGCSSELEYSMRGNPDLSAWGQETMADATTVAGSEHVRRVLEEVCGDVDNVIEVPPGVDVDAWHPQERSRRRSPGCSTRRGASTPSRAT